MEGKNELRVLIIDDNPRDREAYSRFLSTSTDVNYVFLEAITGHEGLELTKHCVPDCILLDFGLPDSDGLEILDEIVSSNVSIAVVMLTGQGSETIAVNALNKGAHDYLVKEQITAESLQRSITNAVEKVSLHRQRIQKQADLERTNKQLEEFTQIASHDLRQPLQSIKVIAGWLEEDYSQVLDDAGKENLSSLNNIAERMDTLILDLLNHAKTNGGQQKREQVNLERIARKVVSELEVHINEAKGHVTVGNLPTIEATETFMYQLFQNLISNAVKYHRKGVPPLVRVSAEVNKEKNICHISVQDNGIGFDEQDVEKIFTPFQRLVHAHEYEGSGIGMATVKKIVDCLNGSISVKSSPGVGSNFTVSLPIKCHS